METKKAYERRLNAGWFDKYITGKVIDIGCGIQGSFGIDPITPDCEKHDKHICDAHTMDAYQDESFDTVYSSHVLEHMEDPVQAIKSWWRILKKGGHLVISVPERDSYERQLALPSRWNPDHKTMWVYEQNFEGYTHELKYLVTFGICEFYDIVDHDTLPFEVVYYAPAITCTNLDRPNEHGDGEYSIEIIVKKL